MHAHEGQKDWIAGEYLDSRNVDGVGGHVATCDQHRLRGMVCYLVRRQYHLQSLRGGRPGIDGMGRTGRGRQKNLGVARATDARGRRLQAARLCCNSGPT